MMQLRSHPWPASALDDDYDVYCGHGPNTTIGHERATNPFLIDA